MAENLVILHGWNSQLERWQSLKSSLEQAGFKVYLPILPGFKGGKVLSRVWKLEDYAVWLEAFLNQKGLSQPILLGHSFGGQLTSLVAIRGKVKLKGLILASAAAIRGRRSLKAWLFLILAKLGKIVCWLPPFCLFVKPLRWLIYKLARENDYYQTSGYLKATIKQIIKQDLSQSLNKIKLPVLILWGQADTATPVKQAYKIKDLIPNSKLVIMPGKHGFLFQQPAAVVESVRVWLKRQ